MSAVVGVRGRYGCGVVKPEEEPAGEQALETTPPDLPSLPGPESAPVRDRLDGSGKRFF